MPAPHNQEADGAGNPSLGAQFGVAGEPPAVQPGIFTADKRRSNGKRDGWSSLVFVKARSACICVPFFCRIGGSGCRPGCEFIRHLGHDPRKTPARRPAHSLAQNGSTPIPAEPGHLELEISLAASPLVVNPRHVFRHHAFFNFSVFISNFGAAAGRRQTGGRFL
jgi:hypothetical protein